MPQTPCRRKLEADWAKPAEGAANGKGPGNLDEFIGEHLRNTNRLREFILGKDKYDTVYVEWCEKQAGHVVARQNHTDTGVMSINTNEKNIQLEVLLEREYASERAEKLDDRLSMIKKKLAKIAPVNMAKTIENAMTDWMEKMVDQLTVKVVKRFEDMVEESGKKYEVRRGKHVETTPENEELSDVEFQPRVTFPQEESEKVERVIRAEMEVDEQRLEQSKHAPVIPPGGVRQESPRLEVGQVTILKKKPVAQAVTQQKKKDANQPEVKPIPKGPKAREMKNPEVKKPEVKIPEGKRPEEKKKETWAQRAAAPLPPKKQPGQAQQQQQQGENKKKADGFQEVKRSQKKAEMKPVPPGQNLMEKTRVAFTRDNGLPL
jgi:hypothetical protein